MTADQDRQLTEAVGKFSAVVTRLEVTARFMERPQFMAMIGEQVQLAMIRSQSDWADRATAAAYSCISASLLDEFADRELIVRRYAGTKPIFSKRSIDEALAAGRLKKAA